MVRHGSDGRTRNSPINIEKGPIFIVVVSWTCNRGRKKSVHVTVVKCRDEMNSTDDLLWIQETEGSRVINWNETYPLEPLHLPTHSVGVLFCSRILLRLCSTGGPEGLGFSSCAAPFTRVRAPNLQRADNVGRRYRSRPDER
jgi:hypothetical protein